MCFSSIHQESGLLSLPSVEEESEDELEPDEIPSTPLLSAIMKKDYEVMKAAAVVIKADNQSLSLSHFGHNYYRYTP